MSVSLPHQCCLTATETTRRSLPLPEYQPWTLSVIYSVKLGWVVFFPAPAVVSPSVPQIYEQMHRLFPEQALESKLAACRNFAKDQKARKAYALDNGNVLNANTVSYTRAMHTSYYDKAWVHLWRGGLITMTFAFGWFCYCGWLTFCPSRTEMVTFPC